MSRHEAIWYDHDGYIAETVANIAINPAPVDQGRS